MSSEFMHIPAGAEPANPGLAAALRAHPDAAAAVGLSPMLAARVAETPVEPAAIDLELLLATPLDVGPVVLRRSMLDAGVPIAPPADAVLAAAHGWLVLVALAARGHTVLLVPGCVMAAEADVPPEHPSRLTPEGRGFVLEHALGLLPPPIEDHAAVLEALWPSWSGRLGPAGLHAWRFA